MRRIIPIVLLALVVLSAPAPAVEAAFELGLYTHYVWRGIILTDGAVGQPSLTITHQKGFSLGLWGNNDFVDDNDTAGDWSELNIILEYAWSPAVWEVAVGLLDYLFPNTPFPSTREVYVRFARAGLISPRLELYHDLADTRGVYVLLALEHAGKITKSLSYSLELAAGFADANFSIGGEAGPHDGNLTLRFDYAGKRLSLAFLAAYTDSLDEDVLLEQPAHLWGGIIAGVSF